MINYKAGDRIHIEFECTINHIDNSFLVVDTDSGLTYTIYPDDYDMNHFLVERENVWTDGDIVQSVANNPHSDRPLVWYRENGSWRTSEEVGIGTDSVINEWISQQWVSIIRKASTGNSTGVSLHFPVGGIKRTVLDH